MKIFGLIINIQIRTAFIIVILSVTFMVGICSAYTPPKGIPNPSVYFSTFGEIDRASPSVATSGNPKCTGWPTGATTGCYYIDNSNGLCSDSGNTYGYPDKPRCTPQSKAYAAGDLIYVHGGPYTSGWDVYGEGTASSPIWIVGNATSYPKFSRELRIGDPASPGTPTSYIVLENFDFGNYYGEYVGRVSVGAKTDSAPVSNIIVRNSTFTGAGKSANMPNTGDVSDGTAITIGASNRNIPNSPTTHVVFYNLTISHYGYLGGLGYGGDGHGAWSVSEYTSYAWLLNSTIHAMGSDAVGGCHNCNTEAKSVNYIFVGGNTISYTGENDIDFKNIHNFVISENVLYGPHTAEQGWHVVIHSSQTGSPPVAPSNGWFIFNKVYSGSTGIAFVSSPRNENMYVVGNLFYDIKASYAHTADPAYNGAAVLFATIKGNGWVVDNTIYDCDSGVKILDGSIGATDNIQVHGNIIANRSDAAGYEIKIPNGKEDYVDLDYNLFHYPSGAATFYWANASRNLAYIRNTAAKCTHCIEGDPLFVSPITGDFKLKYSSPAKNASVEHSVYNKFYTIYGLDIRKDRNGAIRPQKSIWDIGAYEYDLPDPPTNLKIK